MYALYRKEESTQSTNAFMNFAKIKYCKDQFVAISLRKLVFGQKYKLFFIQKRKLAMIDDHFLTLNAETS